MISRIDLDKETLLYEDEIQEDTIIETIIEENIITEDTDKRFIENRDSDAEMLIDPDTISETQKKSLMENFKNTTNKVVDIYMSGVNTIINKASNININFSDAWSTGKDVVKNVGNYSLDLLNETSKKIITGNDMVNGLLGNIVSLCAEGLTTAVSDFSNWAGNELTNIITNTKIRGTSGERFFDTLLNITNIIQDNMTDYQDGVSETSFGMKAETTWFGKSDSFLNYFSKASEGLKLNILSTTPLDSGSEMDSIYGSLMLGAPFLFNSNSDPTNRVLINTFVKDGRFLTLTPGMPKYNGTSYNNTIDNSILNQTSTPQSMLRYLVRNGLDYTFNSKDKRYYTFKPAYEEYFSYLETMLNVIWLKMGLGTENNSTFNIFTFFDIDKAYNKGDGALEINKLKPQYNSSIGFFTNISGAISESISNSRTGFGEELASTANQHSSENQRLNYITGMGTGSALQNASRKIQLGVSGVNNVKDTVLDIFSNTSNAIANRGSGVLGFAKTLANVAIGASKDIINFNTNTDLGSLMQSFSTANGMQLRYPELWESSQYGKNVNLNFTFMSPYGDPLSIFKYVYVPFCALLCFIMPRQAAENGLVSPFLVRADVPGLFTSDLALISDIAWTRGGSQSLWTKDGLPRAIDCSITITDLYEYLAMNKRISYLSANPTFSVFLDSFSGMLSLNDNTSDEDVLNSYFRELLSRVNGFKENGHETNLWNKYNSYKRSAIKSFAESKRASMSSMVDIHSIPWLHNSNI